MEIAKIILAELSKPESLLTFVDDRPGHDRRYAINSSKIEHTLGWHPQYQFEQAIKETIRSEWVKKLELRRAEMNPHLS
ncbi:MAG: dTDP-glucose 4,6-dehydratase [Parcubacteria group bacterium GW2011_GWF2_43_38]|nr:MAG: dTDP-glucose 4,6-dehydratase [Parcubacteria group bacterium GW2011_GWF2_43_38]